MKELLFMVPVILRTVGKDFKHYISDELLKIVHSEACIKSECVCFKGTTQCSSVTR